ncbi:biotin--[acetyl-CoA-carboxylase] ligase [Pleionea sediminis]|uniref:biotin--[acetyl-CoA-carboxylase] ligase n=1 Tax=Pleionea sediminis TaxID=2569479 RepID=UPI0011854B93|nr:biotin--[acetyl-CoA-carboxylase] ligase [Pleionea sediminis]
MKLEPLLQLLSDGQFHSGQDLSNTLGVSRTSVWKKIKKIEQSGIEVFCVRGRGYQIPGGIDLLSKDKIFALLSELVDREDLHVLSSIASTNQFLISRPSCKSNVQICTSEFQYSGRGRLGREWYSPFASNIYLSCKIKLSLSMSELSGLSLAVGCTLADRFQNLGAADIKVKWPNDLKLYGQKVGGVLIELAHDEQKGLEAVIGVGINWNMPENNSIDQSWSNLKGFCAEGLTRNEIVAYIAKTIINTVNQFSALGFVGFKKLWDKFDELNGKPVCLFSTNSKIVGKCSGVNETGAILIEDDGIIKSYNGGEVSIREIIE